jgi:hypothetical protein
MKQVLAIVRSEEPMTRMRVHQQSPLGYSPTAVALKSLAEANYVTRDAANRYVTVPTPKVDARRARREVVRQMFQAFGLFSGENLSAYTRFEYSMAEVRQLLREFEDEGLLVKGFFVRGERTVYWMLKEDLDRVGTLRFAERFVVTPLDNLSLYLRRQIADTWGMGVSYLVFDGPRAVALFKAKRRKWEFQITEFVGEPAARSIVKGWGEANDITVVEDASRIADDEVMEWYEKMYGKGGAK